MRIGQERQPLRDTGIKPGTGALQESPHGGGQLFGLAAERSVGAIEHLVALGQRQQHERLIVEKGALIEGRAVRGAQGTEQSVGPAVVSQEMLEAASDQRACIAPPAQAGRIGEHVNLARLHARATRIGDARALSGQSFVEAAVGAVEAGISPQRQRARDEPALQPRVQLPRRGLGIHVLPGRVLSRQRRPLRTGAQVRRVPRRSRRC